MSDGYDVAGRWRMLGEHLADVGAPEFIFDAHAVLEREYAALLATADAAREVIGARANDLAGYKTGFYATPGGRHVLRARARRRTKGRVMSGFCADFGADLAALRRERDRWPWWRRRWCSRTCAATKGLGGDR